MIIPKNHTRMGRGFTLTEAAIVLGIVGLILGAIWVAAGAVYQNQRTSHANTAVMQLSQGIRTLFATANSTTGLTVANLIIAGAVPTDLVDTAGTGLISVYPNGTTTVLPTTDGLGFVISMGGLNRAACTNLLMSIAGANRDPGLFLASAPATYTAAAIGTPITVDATPALAIAATAGGFGGCTAATGNIVNFGFSLR